MSDFKITPFALVIELVSMLAALALLLQGRSSEEGSIDDPQQAPMDNPDPWGHLEITVSEEVPQYLE